MGASLLALAKPIYYNKSKKPRLQTRMGTVANLKKNQAQSLRKKSRFCRNPRHRKRQECPTYGQVCLKCKKKNHFGSVCQAKQPSQVNGVEGKDDNDSDLPVLNVETVSNLASKGKQVLTELFVLKTMIWLSTKR